MDPNRFLNNLEEGRCKLKTINNVKQSLVLGLGFKMVLSINNVKQSLVLGLGFKMVPGWLKTALTSTKLP